MKVCNPQTPAEWQEAVDAAEFFLLMDSCRQYGLITGCPAVNCDRAEWLIAEGRKRGVTPAPHEALVRKFIRPGGGAV